MSHKKLSSTPSADAFIEAVAEEEEPVVVGGGDAPYPDPSAPVSWSESENMTDGLAALDVGSSMPAVKTAAMDRALQNLQGPHADLIKEAVIGGLARRGASAAWRGSKAGARLTGAAAKAGAKLTGRGAKAGVQGVNRLGQKSRQGLRNRGHDLSISPGRASARLTPEAGFHGYHFNTMA